MRKLITMVSITAMLCSTIGSTNYEAAKAADVARNNTDTVSAGAIKTEEQTPDESSEVNTPEAAVTDEENFRIDWYYDANGKEIWYIEDYTGNSSKVVIPDEYKGEKIEEISYQAFYNHTELEEVQLPKSLKIIDDSAFAGCVNLKKIEIPDTVKTISSYAFGECKNLTNVQLPKALQKIDNDSFWGTSVEEFTIDNENSAFTAVDGSIYNKKCTQLVMVPPKKSKLELPKAVTKINSYAVYENKVLTEVNFSDSLTSIETYAFKACTALKKVELPDTLKTIKESAFEDCSALEEVKLPDTLETIGESAFEDCSALKEVELPNTLKIIDKSIFKGCSVLKEVKLPNTLETIKKSAFADCSALEEVKLPNTLKKIGESAFADCSALEEVKLPNTLKTIGESAFADCSALEEVKLSNTLKTIGESAFAGCTVLKEVKFPNTITSIGWCAFQDCNKIKDIMIPASVTYLANSAFVGCNNVKTFKIHNKNKKYSVSKGDFYNKSKTIFYAPVTKKETVTLLKSVKEVSSVAFDGRENIKKIKVEKGNKYFSVYDDALYNKKKTKLYACPEGKTSIILPATLTTIGRGTLSYDDFDILESCKLKKVQVKAANKKYSSYKGLLYNKKKTKLLFVPMEIKSLVFPKALTDISALRGKGANVTSIAVDAGNKKFKVKDGILYDKEITKVLFCTKNKKNVVLPKTVKGIEYVAFLGCKKLKNITFSENLEYVGDFAFENCDSLEYVSFPDKVATIGTLAFFNCSRLKWVYVPKEVHFSEEFLSHIFAGCNKLSDIYYAGTEKEWGNCWSDEGTDFKEYYPELVDILYSATLPKMTIHYEAKAPL